MHAIVQPVEPIAERMTPACGSGSYHGHRLCVTSRASAGSHRLSAMPAVRRLDPTLLEVVARAATRSGAAALEASHELLAHYSDIGHGPSQRAVDTLVDRAAEALRALTDSLADISDQLQMTAGPTTAGQTTAEQVTAGQATAVVATAVMATPVSGSSGPRPDHPA